MVKSRNPTEALHREALRLAGVAAGTACTQSAYKAGRGTFLFIGPGAKGVGFKAMFKLKASLPEARRLAARDPSRFEVGTTGWVTARFTAEAPMPAELWGRWLIESYTITAGPADAATRKRSKPGPTS